MSTSHEEEFPTPSEDTLGELYISDYGVTYIGDYIEELGYCWVQFDGPT